MEPSKNAQDRRPSCLDQFETDDSLSRTNTNEGFYVVIREIVVKLVRRWLVK